MKWCPKCQALLPLEAFRKDRTKADGLYGLCARHSQETRNERRKVVSQFLAEYKADRPCQDCGGIFAPCVMEFDHRDPAQKVANVTTLAQLGHRRKLLAEMEKCDLVCSNCHRLRTCQRAHTTHLLYRAPSDG